MSTIIIPVTHRVPVPTCPACGQELREPSKPMSLAGRLGVLALVIAWLSGSAAFRYTVMADERDPVVAWAMSLFPIGLGIFIVCVALGFVGWVIWGDGE